MNILGNVGAILGPSLDDFGASLWLHYAIVSNVGAILGLSWGVLGATWVHLGAILGHVGVMCLLRLRHQPIH